MMNLNKASNQVRVVILLLVILIGVGLYSLIYRPENQNIDALLSELNSRNFPIDSPLEEDYSEIILKPSESIKFGTEFLVTYNNWKVEKGYLGKTVEGIKCSVYTVNCPVFIVEKNNFSFYISPRKIQTVFEARDNRFEYKEDLAVPTTEGEKNFTTLNVNVYVPNEAGSLEPNSANVTIQNSIQEVFGCIKDNICFSSGVLPSNPEEHKLYLDAFKDLLLSINTN